MLQRSVSPIDEDIFTPRTPHVNIDQIQIPSPKKSAGKLEKALLKSLDISRASVTTLESVNLELTNTIFKR